MFMNTNVTIYADDTTLVSFGKNERSVLSYMGSTIRKVEIYMLQNNLLKLNQDKTQKIFVWTKILTDSGFTKAFKLLGISIDSTLNWKAHIHNLKTKLLVSLFAIRRYRHIFDRDTLHIIYFSVSHSQSSYGTHLRGNFYLALEVFRLQKQAVRKIANAEYLDHCRPLFKSLTIVSLSSLYMQFMEINNSKKKIQYQLFVSQIS